MYFTMGDVREVVRSQPISGQVDLVTSCLKQHLPGDSTHLGDVQVGDCSGAGNMVGGRRGSHSD